MVELSDLRNRASNALSTASSRIRGDSAADNYTSVGRGDADEVDRAADNYPSVVPDHVKYSTASNITGPHPCSICCTFFSIAGFIFLLLIGSLFVSPGSIYLLTPLSTKDEREAAGHNAFGGAACYVVSGGVSAYYWWKGVQRVRMGGMEGTEGGWRSMDQ